MNVMRVEDLYHLILLHFDGESMVIRKQQRYESSSMYIRYVINNKRVLYINSKGLHGPIAVTHVQSCIAL